MAFKFLIDLTNTEILETELNPVGEIEGYSSVDALKSYAQKNISNWICIDRLLDVHQFQNSNLKFGFDIYSFGYFDSVINNRPGLIILDILIEAIQQFCNLQQVPLNTNQDAYISGNNDYSVVAAIALYRLGFRTINYFSHQSWDRKLNLMGAQLVHIDPDGINREPKQGSILINTLSIDDDIIPSLVFFNFLRSDALFLEFNPLKKVTALSSEAQSIGLNLISPDLLSLIRKNLIQRLVQ